MKIGYIRVSTQEQNTARQEVLMNELGVDKIFIDKCSGKDTNRPALLEMMKYARESDTIIVESISRFARNTRDLLDLIDQLNSKGVNFVSKKESLDTTTVSGKFILTIFGAMFEMERQYILQRQYEGIQLAKLQGKYKGRKKKILPNFESVYTKWKNNELTAVQCINKLNISKTTFYRRIKEYEENSKK